MSATDMKDGVGVPVALTDLSAKGKMSVDELKERVSKISTDEWRKLVSNIEKITEKDINPIEFSIYDYQGFDPIKIITTMKAVSEYHKDKESVLISDIRFSIAANLYMGNLQDKASKKRSDAGKAKIEYLMEKYGIVRGSTGTEIASEIITFPRIASAFPVLTVTMAWKLSPKSVNLEFMSREVPSFMRVNAFCALCSDRIPETSRTFLLECTNAHSSDMSIAYEKGRLKKKHLQVKYDAVDIARNQWNFAEIAANSPVPDESSKLSMLLKLDLPSHYQKMSNVVRNYRALMQKKDIDQIQVVSKEDFERELSDYFSSGT
jgi:hypothetical protein